MKLHVNNNKGISLVEIIISIGVLSVFSLSLLPFFNVQRKTINNSNLNTQCLFEIQKAFIKLESGGAYSVAQPIRNDIVANTLPYGSRPVVFTIPSTDKVSFIDGNDTTFATRFSTLTGGSDLFVVRGANSTEYRRLSRIKDDLSGTFQNTEVHTTDNDGILSYVPLLMRGVVADIADLYNDAQFNGAYGASPDYLKSVDVNTSSPATTDVTLKIDRIRIDDRTIENTSSKFWPIPRNAIGKLDDDTADKYAVRTTDDILKRTTGADRSIDYGRGFRILTFPTDPATEQIAMSWNYGFRVHMKGQLVPTPGSEMVECQMSKEYFLPSDFQNMITPVVDFDFLVSTGAPAGGTVPAFEVDSHLLSDKFYDIPVGGAVAKSRTTNNYCSGNCGTDNFNVVDPKMFNIFTNINIGYDADAGKPMAAYGRNRPECSQDGTVAKTFEIAIRFKNIDKDAGAIPLCLDTSVKPDQLKGYDASGPKTEELWCPTGVNANGDAAAGATTLILNDFLPAQTGFVPCEKLRFCGQNPNSVSVNNFPDGRIEYRYTYTLNNNDNTVDRNRLWGCDLSFSSVIVDLAGNMSYVPALMVDQSVLPAGIAGLRSANELGHAQPIIGSTSLKIYAKPPPCYDCKCKPCKGSKNILGVLVGIFLFVMFIYVAGPIFLSSSGALASTVAALTGPGIAIFSGANLLALVAGVAFLAGAVCGFQLTGATDGGYCSPWNTTVYNGTFRSCKSEPSPSPCECGHQCQKINPPPATFEKDLPLGEKNTSVNGFCGYEIETRTTGATTWKVRKGYRGAGSVIDESTIVSTPSGRKFVQPNGSDYVIDSSFIPENHYATVGDVHSFTFIDKDTGIACYTEHKCDFPASGDHAEWVMNVSQQDGVGGNVDYCAKLKTGYSVVVDPIDSLTKVKKGPVACVGPETSPNPAAPNLWPCSSFESQCYEVQGKYSYADLGTPEGNSSLAWGGKPTSGPPVTQTFQIANADNTSLVNKTLTFAQKIPPTCSTVTVPASQVLATSVPSPNFQNEPPTSHNGVSGNYIGDYLGSFIMNKECADKTNVYRNNFDCSFSCSLYGTPGTGGCTEVPLGFGTCAYDSTPAVTCPIPKPPGCTPQAASHKCTPTPKKCQDRTFTKFDNWQGCEMPQEFIAHLKTNNLGDGMVCFEDYVASSHSSLPACGAPAGSGSVDAAMGMADDSLTGGACTKRGGGSCQQP